MSMSEEVSRYMSEGIGAGSAHREEVGVLGLLL